MLKTGAPFFRTDFRGAFSSDLFSCLICLSNDPFSSLKSAVQWCFTFRQPYEDKFSRISFKQKPPYGGVCFLFVCGAGGDVRFAHRPLAMVQCCSLAPPKICHWHISSRSVLNKHCHLPVRQLVFFCSLINANI